MFQGFQGFVSAANQRGVWHACDVIVQGRRSQGTSSLKLMYGESRRRIAGDHDGDDVDDDDVGEKRKEEVKLKLS